MVGTYALPLTGASSVQLTAVVLHTLLSCPVYHQLHPSLPGWLKSILYGHIWLQTRGCHPLLLLLPLASAAPPLLMIYQAVKEKGCTDLIVSMLDTRGPPHQQNHRDSCRQMM